MPQAKQAEPLPGADDEETKTELVELASLKDHPQNYKKHPDEQLSHVGETIRIAGVYKNIVIAREGTILMGHGVAEAARRAGRKRISAKRLDLDPDDPRALALVAADNEIGNLAERDEARLAAILATVNETIGLLGTGVDDAALTALSQIEHGGFLDRFQSAGPSGGPEGGSVPTADGFFTFSLKLTPAQDKKLQEAIRAARKKWGVKTNLDAILKMCDNVLDGPAGNDGTRRSKGRRSN